MAEVTAFQGCSCWILLVLAGSTCELTSDERCESADARVRHSYRVPPVERQHQTAEVFKCGSSTIMGSTIMGSTRTERGGGHRGWHAVKSGVGRCGRRAVIGRRNASATLQVAQVSDGL